MELDDIDPFDPSKPTFDLTSQKLTAESALKCFLGEYNVILPTPNAQACNNLDEYLHKSTANTCKTINRSSEIEQSSRRRSSLRYSRSQEPFAVPLVRNFEKILKKCKPPNSPSGDSIKISEDGNRRQSNTAKRSRPDVFSRAEGTDLDTGPFAKLRTKLGHVVRVIIRRRRKAPYISRTIEYKGKLILFDKHMNMHLDDVTESFTYSIKGTLLKRARHRDGVIIRGDNVIMVEQ